MSRRNPAAEADTPVDTTAIQTAEGEGLAPPEGQREEGQPTGSGFEGLSTEQVQSQPGVGGEPKAADTPVEPRTTWLTARASETHGPAGTFLDLTEDEANAAAEGVLVRPTEDQLALRVR